MAAPIRVRSVHLTGIELMHMLRNGQLEDGIEQALSAADQFYALAS
ncbi:hypothetical protein [Candidatus Entotheonella palauensis]|uniref:Uncharacterized protein n=1 Tax=Candidatus Entotheonella gemina TaxID=1429439 RepID=W4MFF8_9BACT|nr:MAG: hypothetical protein ETSY2_02430 [Candidatus Entotheonella gemina]